MHMFREENNFFGGHGIVGAQVPIGTGIAFANKYKNKQSITFTFFGDGSRVPLPSLETPIEAYPGIPLRSDRLRARRQARYQVPQPTGMPVGNGRITIQAMPNSGTSPHSDDGMSSAPAPEAIRTPPPTQTRRIRWRRR